MLYCCVSIDFLSQLERTGSKDAPALLEEVKAIATAFGGVAGPRKAPLVLAFPSGGLFDGIQASEALQRIAEAVASRERGLRGVAVAAHDAASAEDALAYLVTARQEGCAGNLYAMSPEAKALLSGYGASAPGAWPEPAYRLALGDADAGRLFDRPRLADTLAKAIGRTARQGPRLMHLDAGRGARDLRSIVASLGDHLDAATAKAHAEANVLCLEGARTKALPFSPLAEAVQESLLAGGAIEMPRSAPGAIQPDGAEPLALVVASAFSRSLPAAVVKGCASYLNRWLDAFGAAGGVVVCDDPEAFSPEARELIAGRLSSGSGCEHYLSIASGGLAEAWAGPWAARVSAGLADGDDIEAARARALGSTEGRRGIGLESRFGILGGIPSRTPDAARADATSAVLELLPAEAASYLYAILAAWPELSGAERPDYVLGLGLLPEGERLLAGLLAKAGLLAPSGRPLPPIDIGTVRKAVGPATAKVIDERLAYFLIGRYKIGRIRPSLGLLGRVGERAEEEGLLYDCVFDAVSRPDLSSDDDPATLSPSSLAIYRFWSALGRRDEEASLATAAEAESSIDGPRSQALRALVSAELCYARGDPAGAAKGAREAMLAMGRNAPPRLEARSQRMMGLSSLALDRHAEASDYLTNAQELAESVGSDHERMMAAYARAIAEYLTGAIGRSSKAARAAEDSARRLHRIDMLAAVEALRGRIDFDLGCYEEAARRFSDLGALCSDYSIADAPERAAIWRARALGYARRYDEAEPVLEARAGDTEALAFRAELDILRGRPRDARAWLEPERPPTGRASSGRASSGRTFMPPDAVDWSSLYAEFEGRSLGFSGSASPLATFTAALSLFARGLDERDPACALELHALSRSERGSRHDPGMGTYCFFCYLLEERLPEPPVDRQTVLSRAFKLLQERSGRIEERSHRSLYMEKNIWNRRLMEAAREHKFI